MQATINAARRFCRDAVNFIFPPCCVWCREHLASNEDLQLCRRCCEALAPPVLNRCRRCSAPVGPYIQTDSGCLNCRADSPLFSGAVSLGTYDAELRRAVSRCKSANQRPLTTALALLLEDQQADLLRSWDLHLVLPVSHHWLDRLLVTEHAADVLAEQLARLLDIPVDHHLIVKTKRTRKQRNLTASARRAMPKNLFRVHQGARLSGTRILLTDDVMTTGTTVNRVSQALLAAGAEQVYVAVLARTVGV